MKYKHILIGLLIPVILLTGVASVLFFQKDKILSDILREKLSQIEERTGYHVSFQQLQTPALRTIKLHGLVVQKENDTLATIEDVETRISLWGTIHRSQEINRIITNGTNIVIKADTVQRGDTIQHGSIKKVSLNEKLEKLRKYVAIAQSKLPSEIRMNQTLLHYQKDSSRIEVVFPELKLKDQSFFSQAIIKEEIFGKETFTQYCILEGDMSDITQEECRFQIYRNAQVPEKLRIPFLKEKYDSDIRVDTLLCSLKINEADGDFLSCTGVFDCRNLSIENRRIASDTVTVENLKLNYNVRFSSHEIEIDSSSVLTINHLNAHPYIHLVLRDSTPTLEVNLNTGEQNSQDLFDALPNGLFKNLRGIKTEGMLGYRFHFKVDMAQVDSLEFESSLTPTRKDFKILSFGQTDFRSVSQPFTYHAYEDGKEVAQVIIGEENTHFRPLDEISPYLQHAVMCSEDGLFFYHKGFLETAIRAALVKDIQVRRFARGGSTISMQLVKNLWLSREKTITRKMEEALIVWLIENKRLLSKERMYEIYLNIIEWGPGIYGASQAAHFYFDKDASNLTIEESIFLASIIPRPKKFYWLFDNQHKLRDFLVPYYEVIGSKLLKREIITEAQYEKITPSVTITGEALKYLAPIDTCHAQEDEEAQILLDEIKQEKE